MIIWSSDPLTKSKYLKVTALQKLTVKGLITWNILWGCNNEIIVAREQTCGGVVTVYSMYSNAHILCQVSTELQVNCFSVLPPDVLRVQYCDAVSGL